MKGRYQEAGEGLPRVSLKSEATVIDSHTLGVAYKRDSGRAQRRGASRGGWSHPTPAGLAWLRSALVCPCPPLPPPPPRRWPLSRCCWS